MTEPKRPSHSALVVVGTIFGCFLLLAVLVCMPNLVRRGPRKTNHIINNLRQLDGAAQQWALDHGRTGAVLVTKEDIAPYLRHFQTPDGLIKPVAGELYILKTLTESPEAQLTREVEGRPKGTLFRFATNGDIEIILPNKDGK